MTTPKDVNSEWEDPIVAEVRAIRARILEEAGGTLDGLFARIRAKEAELVDLVLAPNAPPRPRTDVA